MQSLNVLIYGYKGWIASEFMQHINNLKPHWIVVEGKQRVDDIESVRQELLETNPDRVLCLIGRTHSPEYNTIDCLEQKGMLGPNIRDNLFAPVALALLCKDLGVPMMYLGTGCIYEYHLLRYHLYTKGTTIFIRCKKPSSLCQKCMCKVNTL